MIVLIAVAAWMLALVLVTGLCVAARRGDRAELQDRARERGRPVTAPPAPDRARPAPSSPPLRSAA
jgi:hypothetical protein